MAEPEFTTEELQQEVWKDIPGFEGTYQASTLGRIRSIRNRTCSYIGRLLKFTESTHGGYYRVVLYQHKRRLRPLFVHRVIALTFNGPRPPEHQVNHIDCNKNNNRPNNLEYLTVRDHIRHSTEHGLRKIGDRHWSHLHPEWRAYGEHHGRSTLTNEQAKHIKQLLATGLGPTAVARMTGYCSIKVVKDINRGKSWGHIAI